MRTPGHDESWRWLVTERVVAALEQASVRHCRGVAIRRPENVLRSCSQRASRWI
jgi:hypothetical protein